METTIGRSGATGGRAAGWVSTLRLVSIGLIVLGALALARRVPVDDALGALGGWLDGLGPWGPLAFGAVYAAAVVLMVPGSPLTLAAGALFGPVIGTITVSIASNVGAALAFLIARHLARDAVARRARGSSKFEALDRAIGEGGWKIVALLRLSPAVPFNLQNYLYGVTRIGFWPCVLASWVAMLPGTFLYVYLGHVGRAGLEAAAGSGRSRSPAEWAMIVVGLLATVAVTVYVTRLARRAMKERSGLSSGVEAPTSEGAGPSAGVPTPVRRVLGTAALAVLALGVAGTALAVELRPELLRSAATLLGAPPPAELREVYAERPGGPRVDHGRLDALLRAHVSEGGWVDYRGLQRDAARLDRYLEELAAAPFDELGRDEKLALLINAYNAFTLKLILEHYPIDSIRSIPAERRWDAVRWRVGPHTWSLNEIEHEQVRPKFREPRIHLALVCAAVGCPPLRAEAYAADRLEEQLGDQARHVHTHPRWLRWDGGDAIALTSLYKWYGGDFEQVAGSVLAFVARDVPALAARLEGGRPPEIRWLDYDWSLNDRENRTTEEER